MLLFCIIGCGTTIKSVITSDPPGADIYMGNAPDNMSYAGTTPKTFEYHGNAPYWKAYYYQIKKDGFEDSDVIYKTEEEIDADRYVHARLTPLANGDTHAEQKTVEDSTAIEKAEGEKVPDTKETSTQETIKPSPSQTQREDENVKCAEIRRLSDESWDFYKKVPPPPHNFQWDWGTKSYQPPLQPHLRRFSKFNVNSLKILSLMNELHTARSGKEIPDCNMSPHITFCRKATLSFSGTGMIDREDARIRYKITGTAPAMLTMDFVVAVSPIDIFGYGFSIICELPLITCVSTHVALSGHYIFLGERFRATEFASFGGPHIFMALQNMTQEKPSSPSHFTVTVHPPNVAFYSKKGPIEGGIVRCLDYQWPPISLTTKDFHKAFETGRLTLQRKTETESSSGTVTIDFAPLDPAFQASRQSVSAGIGLWGNRTTHGGFLLATGAEVFSEGHPVAREGDPVLCPIHGLTKVSRDESSGVYIGDKTVAVAGGKTECGAKIVSGSTVTLVQRVNK